MDAKTNGAFKVHPGTLYNYTAGVNCGVLVTERVMRKLVALQAEHLEAVKRLLYDCSGDVFPSMWTLHHPEGRQTVVNFIDTRLTVEERIRTALTSHQPEPCFPVFIAGSMREAEQMADARHAALNQESTP